MTARSRSLIAIGILALLVIILRSCGGGSDREIATVFTISRNAEAADIREKLGAQDYAKGRWFLGLAMMLHGGYGAVDAGGYRIPSDVGTWELASILTGDPPLKWVVIPEGLRKEQVADRVATALGWDEEKEGRFLALSDSLQTPYDLTEGFYFPDTYLIPTDEDEEKVTRRFINRFNEEFDPYYDEFGTQNIRPGTGVRLASIIQREAAGAADMPLIAGILWNRLLQKMPLEVDATLQYARGDDGDGYWAPITPAAKAINSPFNTYKNPGLPPQPISNPGMTAIEAVLRPEETPCIFYLHAPDRSIHCGVTYEEHLENIDRYLRGN